MIQDDAEATADLFKDNVFRFHGMPLDVVSDRGPAFTNRFAAALLKALGTRHCKSTAYHPASNGQTERMNYFYIASLCYYIISGTCTVFGGQLTYGSGSNKGNYINPLYYATSMPAQTGYTVSGGFFATAGHYFTFGFGCASQTTIKIEAPTGAPFATFALIR